MSALVHAPLPIPGSSPGFGVGPILIASDGTEASSEALLTAGQLAAEVLGGAPEIIGVCEPMPGIATGMELLPVPPEIDESRRVSLLGDLERIVSVAEAGNTSWPIHVVIGAPPRTLAQLADQRSATLLVMGIGRHNPLDRLFGTETTLATLRESHVPILAVPPHFATPSHAVVGLDFSAASVRAARLALRLLSPGGKLTLVHVRPRFEQPSADWQQWDAEYARTLPPLFEQLRNQLNPPAGITVDTIAVRGDPAPALLAFAQQSNAELIAVGTQRKTFVERLVVGSVATRVLRTARTAVLAVPA